MVRAYLPQKSNHSLSTDANTPPQGRLVATITPPAVTPAPKIISLIIADDPSNPDGVYSVNDRIIITFDSNTNEPGGTGRQTRAAIFDLFTFSEYIGTTYRGQWTAADTFTITMTGITNYAIAKGITTVTPRGTTSILSADGTSMPSSAVSPVLDGDIEL